MRTLTKLIYVCASTVLTSFPSGCSITHPVCSIPIRTSMSINAPTGEEPALIRAFEILNACPQKNIQIENGILVTEAKGDPGTNRVLFSIIASETVSDTPTRTALSGYILGSDGEVGMPGETINMEHRKLLTPTAFAEGFPYMMNRISPAPIQSSKYLSELMTGCARSCDPIKVVEVKRGSEGVAVLFEPDSQQR